MFQMSCKEHFHNPEAGKPNKQKPPAAQTAFDDCVVAKPLKCVCVCVCVLQLKLKQVILLSMNPFSATVPSLADFSSQAD